jgi:KaiC/GvpD/RAD55 family RecA-like ATPase
VRGPPGAGKTTFALGVLQRFEGYRVFVSARVPRAAILRDHPWLNPSGGAQLDILESFRFRGTPGPGGLQVGTLRDVLQARASDLVELSSVMNLPQSLEAALAAHTNEPKLVTIDSWEAWVENILGPSSLALDVPTTRWELERSLLDVFHAAGAHTMLVVEREQETRLDYIADGALSLTFKESDGRADRWISFQKLRGVRIGSLSYPFTLEGGRFRCIQPGAFHVPFPFLPDDPDPEPGAAGLWPGSADLARQFGRLPIPGQTLLEEDGETPVRLLGRLVIPMVASALRSGGHVVVRPPGHLSAQALWKLLEPIRNSPELDTGLRILSSDPPDTLPGTREGPFLQVDGEGLVEAGAAVRRLDSTGFLSESLPPNARSLVVIFVDSPLEPSGAGAGSELYRTLIDVARNSGNVGVVLAARTGDPFIEPIRSRSAVHLLVHSSRGQYFLTGIRPWTPHFALALHRGDGAAAHPYELVPIV